MEGMFRDPVPPADLLLLGPGLGFLQDSDDLFFSESLPLQGEFSSFVVPENSLSMWTVLWGEVNLLAPVLLSLTFQKSCYPRTFAKGSKEK